ncbi:hypothetical protein DID88_007627 [Monilinia fructigena]|uniref:Uncharacterized protein n=1 Tax=Monilinia fructigena TaxID=38457 RepID=A0A395J402_9HELO|nr:hypothetical protein DID88_007627 [Monilinia fructigena]
MTEHEVSHGRGGAGNIGADSTQYVDGEIVRQGPAGDHGDGAFSVGRGGAANIGSPGLPATKRSDADSIPDVALRPSTDGEDCAFWTRRRRQCGQCDEAGSRASSWIGG